MTSPVQLQVKSRQVRFDGRVVIVTGAARGIGREFALLLARRGASVLVNDIDGADDVVDEIRAAGGSALDCAVPVGSASSAAEIVENALDAFGRIDSVINNAGALVLKPFEEFTEEDFVRTMTVNLAGPWHLTASAWPHMKKQGFGRVLMVASANGTAFATVDHAAYCATKAGLAGLARALAVEGGPLGIYVNALLPGADTRLLQRNPTSSRASIDMRAELVAPGACWLIHADCEANGQLYAVSSGRIGRVFTGVAAGYQAVADDFTLESVRDNWTTAATTAPFVETRSVDDFNKFRTECYEQVHRAVSTTATPGLKI